MLFYFFYDGQVDYNWNAIAAADPPIHSFIIYIRKGKIGIVGHLPQSVTGRESINRTENGFLYLVTKKKNYLGL